jgi:peptidyl-prolyl cis-trans isomerase B (cyclophilin B)
MQTCVRVNINLNFFFWDKYWYNVEENIIKQGEFIMNPIVTIKLETGKEIKLELYPEIAPNTVRNFVSLVKKGFYDGLKFHRVIPGFMIQGGCPEGIGIGGPGYKIKGEFSANRFQNDLKHTKGVISMARSQHNDSAGSQFFIMTSDSPHLDGQYAAFGKVIEGLDNALDIVRVDRDYRDMPKVDQIMSSVTVEHAEEIGEPEVL